jgi:hypothetical protein
MYVINLTMYLHKISFIDNLLQITKLNQNEYILHNNKKL